MNENTNNQTIDTAVQAQTLRDFTNAVLVVSLAVNLTLFMSWVLQAAASGAL